MAKSLSRRVSAQEATILAQETGMQLESRFECSICLNRLVDPVLVSCGHHFCSKCITAWIRKENTCCPIDNKLLIESDIFPDNIMSTSRRSTMQVRHFCRSSTLGCQTSASQPELSTFSQREDNLQCPFKHCGCSFRGNAQYIMDAHLKSETTMHLNMLMTTLAKVKILDGKPQDTDRQWECLLKTTTVANGETKSMENILKSLFDRIVQLEQTNREKDMKIEKLIQQISRFSLTSDVHAKYSHGVLIWRITQFQNKVQAMGLDPNKMYYSNEAYTSPHGYKFCARINISPKVKDSIGLHVHLMQSENDFHLDWPFRGRIKISMIHRNISETKHDTIMSKPEILAFHRPAQDISPRGFGFMEYANISESMRKGFVVMDTLTIKIQLSIV